MEDESKNKDTADTAVLQVMMEEISANQEAAGQQLSQLLKDVLVINNQLSQLNQRPVQQVSPAPDQTISIHATIERSIKNTLSDLQLTSHKTVKEFRILLFPEQDRTLFYKIVFGRWLLYLVIMLALNNIYKWSVNYSNNSKQLKIMEINTDKLNSSWQYVYSHSNKATKRLMESAYFNFKTKDTVNNNH